MTGHGRHRRPADAARHRCRLLTPVHKLARGDILPAAVLAGQYEVSVQVTRNALAMLAANRYVSRSGAFRSYSVCWQAGA